MSSSSLSSTSERMPKQQKMSHEDFLVAASEGNLVQMKECIHQGVDTEETDKDGKTALHIASNNGQLEIVKYLIETCHVDKEAKDDTGWTALHFASRNGNLEIVKYLIEACNVNKEAKNNSGCTALHLASFFGHLVIVKYLIETCFVNKEAKSNNGSTALHFASQFGHLVIVKYLIETCHVDMEAKDNDGLTTYDISNRNVTYYLKAKRNETSSGVISDNKYKLNPENEVADEACHFVVVTSSLCLCLIDVFTFLSDFQAKKNNRDNMDNDPIQENFMECRKNEAAATNHGERIRMLEERVQAYDTYFEKLVNFITGGKN